MRITNTNVYILEPEFHTEETVQNIALNKRFIVRSYCSLINAILPGQLQLFILIFSCDKTHYFHYMALINIDFEIPLSVSDHVIYLLMIKT